MERTFSFIVGKHTVYVILNANSFLVNHINKNAKKNPDIENKTFDDVEKSLRKILSDIFFKPGLLSNNYTLSIKLARSNLFMRSKADLKRSIAGEIGYIKIVDTGSNFMISQKLTLLIEEEINRLFHAKKDN